MDNIYCLGYGDNLATIVKRKFASTVSEDAQRVLQIAYNWCRKELHPEDHSVDIRRMRNAKCTIMTKLRKRDYSGLDPCRWGPEGFGNGNLTDEQRE